jgi:acylphosphatase
MAEQTPERAQAVRAVAVRIEGRVQGVWFRGWAVEEAARRGLRGWVRNRNDGSVEALFIGPGQSVSAMVAACRRGPPAARVSKVLEQGAEDDGSFDFRQRQTE